MRSEGGIIMETDRETETETETETEGSRRGARGIDIYFQDKVYRNGSTLLSILLLLCTCPEVKLAFYLTIP